MSRLLRHLLIWLSCTAASVTAVMITIHFVVGSTRPTAPVAQSAPEELPASPPPAPSPSAKPSSPSPSPSGGRPAPAPSRKRERPPEPSPAPKPSPSPSPTGRETRTEEGGRGCEEGASGVYTVPSEGGKATVRFGDGGVCLVSAVPNQGFTASTSQSAPETLTVTFSASRHRSEITATTEPSRQAGVREVSF